MSRMKITRGLKGSGILFKPIFTMVLTLLLISLLAACASPAATTQAPTISAPAVTTQTPGSSVLATTATAPMTTKAATARPQGELVAAVQTFGNENFIPWQDPAIANLHDLVYDLLIYWDHINFKFFPGLAETWEVSPDGLTLTYHLRKGVQFHDGWGEFTSEDVKYNFEMHASKTSVGKTSQTRRIASMDTPDSHTLVVHFKDPYPTFFVDLSMANSGVCQGIVSKKYLETVGVEAASQKPIGTGPYRLADSQLGSYYKFEALDSHWRVVPEFKTLTVRLIPETSTLVAALKNKEIDLSQVPADQLADLNAAGVGVEVSPIGGNILNVSLGGMIIPADKRYDAALDNKDPWTDVRVRKAMAISIDREAICKAIYAGFAEPAGVPLFSTDMNKYKYPYDPAAARQLLKDAGYPNGFSLQVISSTLPASVEAPRIMEALAGYWQQIGLGPKINVINYNTYYSKNIVPCKTAGDVSLVQIGSTADMLTKAEVFLVPNATNVVYLDEGSFAIYRDNPKLTMEERLVVVDKLNQYYFENAGPIPVIRNGYCFAWNSDKILPWPHYDSTKPLYLEYVRHAQPLNTFRLFSPWPDR
jgi:peptide/nickel transport system substrate-binding protein